MTQVDIWPFYGKVKFYGKFLWQGQILVHVFPLIRKTSKI